MGPSSHCHRKSCTALPDIFSSFALSSRSSAFASARSNFCAPNSPFVIRVFPHIENYTVKQVLTRYLSSFAFRFLHGLASVPLSRYPLSSAFARTRFLRFASLRSSASPLHAVFSSPALLSSLLSDQALDRLVSASSHVTMLSPLTYLPCRLQGVLLACAMAVFFLRWASRLDAFSVYPLRTSLPCYAVGTTTVAPVVRSPRSSRTRGNSSHDSCAHDG